MAGLALGALLLLGAPAGAAPDVPPGASGSGAPDDDGDPTVHARLLADVEAVGADGRLRLGVLFEMEPDWHIYWRNPGDTGFATRLSWRVPYADVGPTHWPAPEAFVEEETLRTYGYADRALLFHEVQVAAAPGTRLDVAVDADFLVCRVQCIPGRITLERTLPVAETRRPADEETRALFDRWQARVPRPASQLGLSVDGIYSQSAIRPGDGFRAALSLSCEPTDDGTADACPRGLEAATRDPRESFAPYATPSLRVEATGTRAHPFAAGLLLTLTGHANTEDVPVDERLRGVARLRDADGRFLPVEVDVPLPRAAAGAPVETRAIPWLEPEPRAPTASISAWRVIGLALLGGLVLNLMPCVLPVLAIKVFGIAERAHARRRDVAAHGAAYTLGILASMAALAALVVGLRAAGAAVGWGFQFQEPLFLAAISSLLVVFALNLFGVFEVGLPDAVRLELAGAGGLSRSFLEGLLAVLLATPCSAPFLGTAVGFAFASPAPVILGIFLAIGVGLASPLVAVSLLPGLARFLPRSGPWMVWLRVALGFALLATVVWLLWIAGRVLGTDGMSLLLAFLVLLAAGVTVYGARQRTSDAGRAPWMGASLVLLCGLALLWLPLSPPAADPAPRSIASGSADGEAGDGDPLGAPFARAAVASELAAGRPVFVTFTADWCLTCKVNERVVLRDPRIDAALDRHDVARFVADWTRRDEAIRSELARFGRAGVPLYLVYDPRTPDRPEILPELLTVDRVLEALEALGA